MKTDPHPSISRRRALLAMPAVLTAGCLPRRVVNVPMRSLADRFPGRAPKRNLIVFMPGVYDKPEDFVEYYFVHELRRRRMPVDVVLADAHLGYFQDGTIVERLRRDIIEPAMTDQPVAIWMVGVSLGGLGAMLYAAQDERVAGIVALAPYLGTKPALAEVAAVGGWAQWDPATSQAMLNWELGLHRWLKTYLQAPASMPHLLLAYGEQDRYVSDHAVLARQLPPANVQTLAGGHDWSTWQGLWRAVIDRHGQKMLPPAGARL